MGQAILPLYHDSVVSCKPKDDITLWTNWLLLYLQNGGGPNQNDCIAVGSDTITSVAGMQSKM